MTVPDPTALPHLLALLDDSSRVVRDAVLGKLDEFGPALEQELLRLPDPPSEPTIVRLRAQLDRYRATVRDFYEPRPEGTVIRQALFEPGQLVRHRRYGYRGVVVDRDLSCEASEEWYRRNRSQPERDQPWYHVLVHDSDATTYAAQTSLLPDTDGGEVRHALVRYFFERHVDGRYVRNSTEWPSGS
jgi:heat shock protein HspQ